MARPDRYRGARACRQEARTGESYGIGKVWMAANEERNEGNEGRRRQEARRAMQAKSKWRVSGAANITCFINTHTGSRRARCAKLKELHVRPQKPMREKQNPQMLTCANEKEKPGPDAIPSPRVPPASSSLAGLRRLPLQNPRHGSPGRIVKHDTDA